MESATTAFSATAHPSSGATKHSNARSSPQRRMLWTTTTAAAVLLLLFNVIYSIEALPLDNTEGRVFFAALLRDADGRNSIVPLNDAPMFELFAGGPQIEQQKKRRDLGGRHHHIREPMLAKKYDRNCFFSPVQCTLQQWGDGNPADEVLLGGGAGRRRRR